MSHNPEKYAGEYWLNALENRIPTRSHNPSIVEYAETTIVPSGKYRGLPFRHYRAPQLKEPLALLSPESPYTDVVFMTPAQFGKSTLAELLVMYGITQIPSEILYVSSDEKAAIKWMSRRIEPRAFEAGVQFQAEIENNARNKSGSNRYSKIFPGGNIDIASALSPSQLASETKRICIGDEVDRWKVTLGAEGSVVDMIKARTQAWDRQAIRLWISTPTTVQESLIYQMFLQGDQRQYWVPCPYCGTMQLMDFEEGRGHGIVYETKNGSPVRKSVELICENETCGRGIKESKKPKMLIDGEWRTGAISQYDTLASFTSNGLYSHMLSWYEMVVAHHEAKTSPVKKQAFDNLKMGNAYIDVGVRPKKEKLNIHRGTYKRGEVPEGVLYLVAFFDVQRGSKDDPKNPPRIEGEILGVGYAYKTWTIEYVRFEGGIKDINTGAWEKLRQWAIATELTFTRKIDDFKFPVRLVFIDSGYKSDVVYNFCSTWQGTYPSKGFSDLKKRKNEHEDEVTQSNLKRYRPITVGGSTTLYTINTVYYKNQFYNSLDIKRVSGDVQQPGFWEFPADLEQEVVDMYTAEDKIIEGHQVKYSSGGRRNEALDCHVGNLCLADVYLDSELEIYKEHARREGKTKEQIAAMKNRIVIDEMIRQTAVKKP